MGQYFAFIFYTQDNDDDADVIRLKLPGGAATTGTVAWENINAMTIDQAATIQTTTGALTIDGDDGIVLQTSGSGHITTAENIQSTSNTQAASIATAYANYGLVFRAPQATNEYSNSIGWSEGTNVAAAISAQDDGGGCLLYTSDAADE